MLYILRLAAKAFRQAVDLVFHFLTGFYFQRLSDTSLTPSTMKNIIILGGSYVGISTAHRILKQSANTGTVKVTLVSPNSHFYWNMASPRGLISGELVDDKLFLPTAAGFSQYKASQFEFILASAENLDIKAKKVELSSPAGNKTLEYDLLILATGSSTQGETPFKGLGSTEKTQYAIRNFQARVKEAKTIVLAGAGATGVELAGELGFKYGKQKDVILVSL